MASVHHSVVIIVYIVQVLNDCHTASPAAVRYTSINDAQQTVSFCWCLQTMRRHLRRRHLDHVTWQTTDMLRKFIETLAIQTSIKLIDNNQDVTVASSCSNDIQETEVPLMIGVDTDLTLDYCPQAFLSVDLNWSAELN